MAGGCEWGGVCGFCGVSDLGGEEWCETGSNGFPSWYSVSAGCGESVS